MVRFGETLLGNSAGNICGRIDHRFNADHWVSAIIFRSFTFGVQNARLMRKADGLVANLNHLYLIVELFRFHC